MDRNSSRLNLFLRVYREYCIVMSNIIDAIESGYGIPVNSRGAAIQQFNDDARSGLYDLGTVLRNILNADVQALHEAGENIPEGHTRVQVAYVIDGAVAAHLDGREIDPGELYVTATKQARDFIKKMPWVFAEKEKDVKLDASGKPRAKKGSKGARSYELYCQLTGEGASRKEIMEAFQNEDRMAPLPVHTKKGATTYFYIMKKKYDKEHS